MLTPTRKLLGCSQTSLMPPIPRSRWRRWLVSATVSVTTGKERVCGDRAAHDSCPGHNRCYCPPRGYLLLENVLHVILAYRQWLPVPHPGPAVQIGQFADLDRVVGPALLLENPGDLRHLSSYLRRQIQSSQIV